MVSSLPLSALPWPARTIASLVAGYVRHPEDSFSCFSATASCSIVGIGNSIAIELVSEEQTALEILRYAASSLGPA